MFGQMSTTAWKKFGTQEKDVLELRRLVLLDDVGHNAESKTIGWCLRWLKKNTLVQCVVSYADPNVGHAGTIYRAANFAYRGLSGADKGFYDPESGKTYHSRALRTTYKGNYKPFVQRLRDKYAKGLLEPVTLQGKHCFTYKLQGSRR